MKRRGQIDVAVVGGGVVGAACALVLDWRADPVPGIEPSVPR